MKRNSTRFSPSKWSQCIVPALLILLALGLLATVVIVILSIIGVTPHW